MSTNTLLNRLFQTGSITGFITRHKDEMTQTPFHTYLTQLCEERDAVQERVVLKAGIARTYGHQFFKGTRKPSRDKVIQLAFGFELNYDETQALLKAARKSPLYAKLERDAAIIYALSNGLGIVKTQAMLEELALPVLGKEDKYE